MSDKYIQVYSLTHITRNFESQLADKRLTVLNIGRKHKQHFIEDKPYQFTVFGLIFIKKGQCKITINLEPTVVRKDDILVVLPNQFFEIQKHCDDFEVQILFIDPDLFIEAGFHLKSGNLIDFLSSVNPKVISLSSKMIKTVDYNLKALRKLQFNKDHQYVQPLIINHFSILMYELGNFYSKITSSANETRKRRTEQIAKSFLYLVATHYKKERSVAFYASQIFITRKHLTKIITEVFQKTPKQIITETLILEAKVQLRNPQMSIAEVICKLNFSDASVFSKFFKTHTGLSPRDFKSKN